jgi:hypothetical protein
MMLPSCIERPFRASQAGHPDNRRVLVGTIQAQIVDVEWRQPQTNRGKLLLSCGDNSANVTGKAVDVFVGDNRRHIVGDNSGFSKFGAIDSLLTGVLMHDAAISRAREIASRVLMPFVGQNDRTSWIANRIIHRTGQPEP